MRVSIVSLLATTLAISVSATGVQYTVITIETSQDESNPDGANSTIVVPVGPLYKNKTALASVSKLSILRDDSVSCIPYYAEIATGPHGNPFTFGHPVEFPDDPVVVGSIMCTGAMGQEAITNVSRKSTTP
ncbi:hypothetical protein ONZ43_g6606 [Nemania bipapillata]|uniref:Uncharacterized protein n=1 Tax=Nemania bipapillata TaxID=110536 RepID=A0ACC2HXN6_9PEZI|nr:hypothetical protein ONZ43_g6606 [Nemania bipapillata]